jgi:SAM-dependent methyltransferase
LEDSELINALNNESSHIQKSFSTEWEALAENDRAWGRSVETRLYEFKERLLLKDSDLTNKKVLDAGCGHGEIEFALSPFFIDLVALDISNSIEDIKKRYEMNSSLVKNARIHFIQADISQLPLKEELFDYIFSDGVLHHTPNTKQSFINISKTLQKNGKCFIMVYSYDHKTIWDKILDRTIQIIRKISKLINPRILYLICYILSPIYFLYVSLMNLFVNKKRHRTKRSLKELSLSLFDTFSPMFDWNHSTEEVITWYNELNYSDVKKTFSSHIGIGIVGRKQFKL